MSSQSTSKATKIMVAVAVLLCLGATLYAFSPYYIPKNYLATTGQLRNNDYSGRDKNYYISFTTSAGRAVTYKYQTIVPDDSLGPNVSLYYNVNNPLQVKIKPSRSVLLADLALADLFIPLVAVIFILSYRQAAKKQ